MAADEPVISPARLESIAAMQQSAVAGMRAVFRMRAVLGTVIAATFALMLSTTAHAATITVNSLADPGRTGICALRDAITAANTKRATHGCAPGTGSDTIQFRVTGTITLGSTLPKVTDRQLTITGPIIGPGHITISGGGRVQMMQVALGARLNLTKLGIVNGNNLSTDKGGGIDNEGTLTLYNTTFSDNSAGSENGETGFGGAIYNGGTLTVTNSVISNDPSSNNNANAYGAGIYNEGRLMVINSQISGSAAGWDGGGIYNDRGRTAAVSKTIFSNDGLGGFGGAIYNGGTLTVTNSTLSSNSASVGAGIANFETLTVTNSTFSGNDAANGGGIYNGGTLTVTNSTLSGNSAAAGSGGGIYNEGNASLKSTIMAASTSGNNCVAAITITDAGYNISDDSTCNFSATGSQNNTNPGLSSAGLANNGGPTQTIALVPGSPAIDGIPLTACTDQNGKRITTDQRGFPRPDAAEAACDIGAYESSF